MKRLVEKLFFFLLERSFGWWRGGGFVGWFCGVSERPVCSQTGGAVLQAVTNGWCLLQPVLAAAAVQVSQARCYSTEHVS